MIKTELVSLCQQQAQQKKAQEYSVYVQKQRKRSKAKRVVTGILVTTFFITVFGIAGKQDVETLQAKQVEAKEITTESEQKYIVRYGTMENNLIGTEDGNKWSLIDGPEYKDGTEVRVLFDSRETKDAKDDAIIDITERR